MFFSKKNFHSTLVTALPAPGCSGQVRQDEGNDVKIVKKNNIRAIGLTIRTTFAQNKQAEDIPRFFHDTFESGILDSVKGRVNNSQLCIFIMKPQSPEFIYFMGVEADEKALIPEGFTELNLSANQYASVEIVKKGNSDVVKGFKHILEKWLPKSDYKAVNSPAFIYYDEKFIESYKKYGYKKNPSAAIFIPVALKSPACQINHLK